MFDKLTVGFQNGGGEITLSWGCRKSKKPLTTKLTKINHKGHKEIIINNLPL
jgi:hypothetical protein